jgi:putative membrane protein
MGILKTISRRISQLLMMTGLLVLAAGAAPAMAADKISDADILGILEQANQNEISAAQQVVNRQYNAQVQGYANMLQRDHSDNLQKAHDLAQKLNITPSMDSAEARKEMDKGRDELSKINKLQGDKLAKSYIDDMIKDHTEEIKEIDKNMLPSASSPELKSYLQETRDAMNKHLDQARHIKDNL